MIEDILGDQDSPYFGTLVAEAARCFWEQGLDASEAASRAIELASVEQLQAIFAEKPYICADSLQDRKVELRELVLDTLWSDPNIDAEDNRR